ncbi:YCF48-related protein [Roseateles sp. SL47]|uniref:YCF48-related protein n=1 Tax=Roseateles sp. SL47 TaxID=2995138 RepID=UPI002271357B|nr:YCF48-related protein [Roseateles sp. SL47]WAC70827.1 YCF48-related protein [Roseateles sp. SL47]
MGLAVSQLALASAPVSPTSTRAEDALQRPAVSVKHPGQAVLLGAAVQGARWVAVGERGLIVVSEDGGRQWTQVDSPVSVTLTAVRFANPQFGVAVGHGGVVLVTNNGGREWKARLDGRALGNLLQAQAQSRGDADAMAMAQRLASEGPDKPWLDVSVAGAGQITVVGAYGLALHSDNGGRSWRSFAGPLDNPRGMHLYAIRQVGQRILIAGEQGLVLLSEDGGRSFSRLQTHYKGSFFAAELLPDGGLLVAGLRGQVLRSGDGGQSWVALASPATGAITGIALQANGVPVLASQSGQLLGLQGSALVPWGPQDLPPLNGVVAVDAKRVLALSVRGPIPIELPGGAP